MGRKPHSIGVWVQVIDSASQGLHGLGNDAFGQIDHLGSALIHGQWNAGFTADKAEETLDNTRHGRDKTTRRVVEIANEQFLLAMVFILLMGEPKLDSHHRSWLEDEDIQRELSPDLIQKVEVFQTECYRNILLVNGGAIEPTMALFLAIFRKAITNQEAVVEPVDAASELAIRISIRCQPAFKVVLHREGIRLNLVGNPFKALDLIKDGPNGLCQVFLGWLGETRVGNRKAMDELGNSEEVLSDSCSLEMHAKKAMTRR
jgi:hypothetical protein